MREQLLNHQEGENHINELSSPVDMEICAIRDSVGYIRCGRQQDVKNAVAPENGNLLEKPAVYDHYRYNTLQQWA